MVIYGKKSHITATSFQYDVDILKAVWDSDMVSMGPTIYRQEIWEKLTRRAKAYSISSSVVIVLKIAYHLDSAHRDHNTHRP